MFQSYILYKSITNTLYVTYNYKMHYEPRSLHDLHEQYIIQLELKWDQDRNLCPVQTWAKYAIEIKIVTLMLIDLLPEHFLDFISFKLQHICHSCPGSDCPSRNPTHGYHILCSTKWFHILPNWIQIDLHSDCIALFTFRPLCNSRLFPHGRHCEEIAKE